MNSPRKPALLTSMANSPRIPAAVVGLIGTKKPANTSSSTVVAPSALDAVHNLRFEPSSRPVAGLALVLVPSPRSHNSEDEDDEELLGGHVNNGCQSGEGDGTTGTSSLSDDNDDAETARLRKTANNKKKFAATTTAKPAKLSLGHTNLLLTTGTSSSPSSAATTPAAITKSHTTIAQRFSYGFPTTAAERRVLFSSMRMRPKHLANLNSTTTATVTPAVNASTSSATSTTTVMTTTTAQQPNGSTKTESAETTCSSSISYGAVGSSPIKKVSPTPLESEAAARIAAHGRVSPPRSSSASAAPSHSTPPPQSTSTSNTTPPPLQSYRHNHSHYILNRRRRQFFHSQSVVSSPASVVTANGQISAMNFVSESTVMTTMNSAVAGGVGSDACDSGAETTQTTPRGNSTDTTPSTTLTPALSRSPGPHKYHKQYSFVGSCGSGSNAPFCGGATMPAFNSHILRSLDSIQRIGTVLYSSVDESGSASGPPGRPGSKGWQSQSQWETMNNTFDMDSINEFGDFGEEFENVTLMYAKHEKIPMKDFGSEIRATMDIDHLLNKAVVLLDLPETSLEEIFNKIIHEMDIQEPEFTSEQVKNALFTQDAGNQFHILSRTVQSICTTNLGGGTFDYDQTWICALCMLPTVSHRHVAIARLSHPTNLGRTMQDLRFIIIVIAPARAKGTKTGLETARTFATLFADLDIRQRLVLAQGVDAFRRTMLQAAKELAVEQNQWRERKFSLHLSDAKDQLVGPTRWYLGRGILEDVRRRAPHYLSDYMDGVRGTKTLQKLLSTVVFLYFACLLPSIALGVLNHDNTKGKLGVKKGIYAQAIGGLFFAIFGGQPMIILLTTVPLAIYVKIIYRISQDYNQDFFAMYACVGVWAQFFLILYANTELSNIMRFATRSTEEIFSLFISLAFIVEAFKALHWSFTTCYKSAEDIVESCNKSCHLQFSDTLNDNLTTNSTLLNGSQPNSTSLPSYMQTAIYHGEECHRENSILYILLMAGTLWLGLFLYNFRKTPYLTRARREILADYAMPVAVIAMSCTGAYCFQDIKVERFEYNATAPVGVIAEVWKLQPMAIFASMGLGFFLSFLFFIDQNLTSAIVNNQQNKLRKGSATHLDLFVVAILNMVLSMLGLPWMHAALPHSPLHLRALADVEERASQGHVLEVITYVRETRLAAIIANGLILLSALFMLPVPLNFIPRSVLDGLFLYMAVTSVHGNEMFERVLLLLTEQAAYPPTHYIRRVPQRKVHLFTCCQIIQLVLLCTVGFFPWPYIEMVFPIVVFFFLPIRHVLIPRMIDYKYLDALDGRH